MISMQAKLTAALCAVLLLIGSHWYAYKSGDRNGANAVLVGALQASNAVLTKRADENAASAKQFAIDAQKATKDHAQEIATIRAAARRDAGKRVPIRASFCRPAGESQAAAPGSAGQDDAATAFLPDAFAGDLRQLAADADEVTADLRTLKERAAACFAGSPVLTRY